MGRARRVFKREDALEVFEEFFLRFLRATFLRVEVVGSCRRGKALVHDLDVLAIQKKNASPAVALPNRLLLAQTMETVHLVPGDGSGDHARFVHCDTGLPVDVHLADGLEDWWGRLVVFTGSKEWLARVRRESHGKVCTLHDDGRVELTRGRFARPRTEEAVFKALGIPFVPPEGRN
jgi:DNA polymerase (family 10)